jgi:hypothetical protein
MLIVDGLLLSTKLIATNSTNNDILPNSYTEMVILSCDSDCNVSKTLLIAVYVPAALVIINRRRSKDNITKRNCNTFFVLFA